MSKLTIMLLLVCSFQNICQSQEVRVNSSEVIERIIGGVISHKEVGYQMQLLFRGRHCCGGSLVIVDSRQYVVTAGHCVTRGTKEDYVVVGGELNTDVVSGHEQRRFIWKMIIHPDFDISNTPQNDIAILKLDRPFTINEFVYPINLPKYKQGSNGASVLTGWGITNSAEGKPSPHLKTANLKIMSNYECQHKYNRTGLIIKPTMICTRGDLGGSCKGDSGGPLLAGKNKDAHLAGIVSFARYSCANEDYPSVFTRVSYFIKWIMKVVKQL